MDGWRMGGWVEREGGRKTGTEIGKEGRRGGELEGARESINISERQS